MGEKIKRKRVGIVNSVIAETMYCGICGHKATMTWFFSFKEQDAFGCKLECTYCGSETHIHIDELAAKKEWLMMFPTLFSSI